MTESEDLKAEMQPEWHLNETAEASEPHNFTNVNPRSVFILALLAATAAVSIVLSAYLLIQFSIEAGYIPAPPSLGPYAS